MSSQVATATVSHPGPQDEQVWTPLWILRTHQEQSHPSHLLGQPFPMGSEASSSYFTRAQFTAGCVHHSGVGAGTRPPLLRESEQTWGGGTLWTSGSRRPGRQTAGGPESPASPSTLSEGAQGCQTLDAQGHGFHVPAAGSLPHY